ncbi:AAA family ATPase (plasmid) [Streptomyces goshikiensis]|uniref:AAA family ATPase n=1 Tax=Streptomyces goshikiensis TaxID=1942 RepID=UPI002F90DD66|nr:AAA family ATPase [Streptomyces goshikiensis]
MLFTVLDFNEQPPPNLQGAFLHRDNWDDFGYKTMYVLAVRQANGRLLHVGHLRIGHIGMSGHLVCADDWMPASFESLPSVFFSLGQEDDYYEILNLLPENTAREILLALNDVAYKAINDEPEPRVAGTHVFRTSLMRGTSADDFRRMCRTSHGGERVVAYEWSYTPPATGLLPPHAFTFKATPHSLPPTNLHALIGRNGVGKSSLLHSLAHAVTTGDIAVQSLDAGYDVKLEGCVVVSFSPFDKPYSAAPEAVMELGYIGLRDPDEDRLLSDSELFHRFVNTFELARIGARGERWHRAIKTLNYDASGFLDGHMETLETCRREALRSDLEPLLQPVFDSLSSGHRIVLMIVTHLIAVVTERTLVLMDEPETHLHPPLLAALMRCISDLLAHRNGMAIMATHSPVVLQEIPENCVWCMVRHGFALTAHRPGMETYGENVGELTHAAFGLEVTATGFHSRIAELVDQGLSYEEITGRFTGLGSEARSLLRAMTFRMGR